MSAEPEYLRITFKVLHDKSGRDVWTRVRWVLKRALRSHRLQMVKLEEVNEDGSVCMPAEPASTRSGKD